MKKQTHGLSLPFLNKFDSLILAVCFTYRDFCSELSLSVSCSSSAYRTVHAQPLSGRHLVQYTQWHQWHFTTLSHLWFLHNFVLLELIIPFSSHLHKPALWLIWLCPQLSDLQAGNFDLGYQTCQTLQLTACKILPDSRGHSSVYISYLLPLSSPKVNY